MMPRLALLRYPDTMLGRMFQESNRPMWEGKGPYHFPERDGEVFHSVAQFYATGKLVPPSTSARTFLEYDFWLVAPALPPGMKPALPIRADMDEQMRVMATRFIDSMSTQLTTLAMLGAQRLIMFQWCRDASLCTVSTSSRISRR